MLGWLDWGSYRTGYFKVCSMVGGIGQIDGKIDITICRVE